MAEKIPILKSSIPRGGVTSIRSLKYGAYIEEQITPQLGLAFKTWMKKVARNVSRDWPSRSGKSALEIVDSSHVTYGATLDSIHGYFLVSSKVASLEYGTKVRRPRFAEAIAIPVFYGLYPDGRPKRLGPNSWRALGTFFYRSKDSGQLYLAYKTKDQGIKIVYIIVQTAGALKPIKKFMNGYDRAIPELQGMIGRILSNAIADVYNKQFIDSLNSIDGNLKMNRLPSVIPKAAFRVENLTPRY